MPDRRRYSDDERATALAALAANGGNVRRTSTQLGIPEQTLRQWQNGDRHPEASHMSAEKKAGLADLFELLCRKLVGVAERKADDLDARDAAVAAGIAVDKMQLLRGDPTAINAHRHDLSGLSHDDLRQLETLLRVPPDGQLPVGAEQAVR